MFLDVFGVLRVLSFVQMISDVLICFQRTTNVGCWIFSRSSLGVLLMFSGCSDGSCERGGSRGLFGPIGLGGLVGLVGLVLVL